MNIFVIILLVVCSLYVIGGFIYAGANAMIDLDWARKWYQDIKS